MDLLASVALKHNVWSAVYNLHTKEVHLAIGKRYDKIKKFKLGDWGGE